MCRRWRPRSDGPQDGDDPPALPGDASDADPSPQDPPGVRDAGREGRRPVWQALVEAGRGGPRRGGVWVSPRAPRPGGGRPRLSPKNPKAPPPPRGKRLWAPALPPRLGRHRGLHPRSEVRLRDELVRLRPVVPLAPHPPDPPDRREPHRPPSGRLVPPSVPRRHEGGEVLLPFDAPAEVHLDHPCEKGEVPLILHGRYAVRDPLPSVHGNTDRLTSAMNAGIACTLPVAFFGGLPLRARGLVHAHLHRGHDRPCPPLRPEVGARDGVRSDGPGPRRPPHAGDDRRPAAVVPRSPDVLPLPPPRPPVGPRGDVALSTARDPASVAADLPDRHRPPHGPDDPPPDVRGSPVPHRPGPTHDPGTRPLHAVLPGTVPAGLVLLHRHRAPRGVERAPRPDPVEARARHAEETPDRRPPRRGPRDGRMAGRREARRRICQPRRGGDPDAKSADLVDLAGTPERQRGGLPRGGQPGPSLVLRGLPAPPDKRLVSRIRGRARGGAIHARLHGVHPESVRDRRECDPILGRDVVPWVLRPG